MPFDAGMISALAAELGDRLIGGKIEKIHQPERDKIEIYMRAKGKQERLMISAAPGSPRFGLTALPKENPAVPPMFCVLLRKHLTGAVLRDVSQPGFERSAELRFAGRDELGYETVRTLVCELMGKYCNILLLDETRRILGVLRPIDFTSSEKRQLLAGMPYELPPRQEGKTDPLSETEEGFLEKARLAGDRPADKFLLSAYCGFSPLIAREIAFRACGRCDHPAADAACRLYISFAALTARIREKRFEPCLIHIEGKNSDYSFLPVAQYGDGAKVEPHESASEMLDGFYAEKEREERIHRRAQDLFRILHNAEMRLVKKIEAQKGELAECAGKERYRQYGELIKANLFALRKGDVSVTLVDYYDPALPTVTLTLDGRLTPAEEAQRYFKKYAKAKTAEKELTVQIKKAEEELFYVRSVIDALERATLPAETEEIRRELIENGYISKKKTPPPSKKTGGGDFLSSQTSDGFTVLCGRNNLQNDLLTFRVASKNDWWFHVHNAPGSHVVLLCDGVDDPPASSFTEAAAIAARNSSLRGSGKVTVDYTRVRNIKKPPAARPGYVIYHEYYSAEVASDR